MEYYIICSDQQQVTIEGMQSRFVDIKKYPGQGHFWRGSEVELQVWEAAKKRAAQSKKGGRKAENLEPKVKRKRESGDDGAKSSAKPDDPDDLDLDLDFSVDNLKPGQLHSFPAANHGDYDGDTAKDDDNDTDDIALLWDSMVSIGDVDVVSDDDPVDELPVADLYHDLFQQLGDSDWEDQDGDTEIRDAVVDEIPKEPPLPAAAVTSDEPNERDDFGIVPEPCERKPRAEEKAGRKAKVPEIVFSVPSGGELRYNTVGKFIRAHCHRHPKCTRQRQTTPGRLGAGRPIGGLIAWLQRDADDKAHHMSYTPSFEKRLAARQQFNQWDGSEEFSQFERKKYNWEVGEEPEIL